MPAAKNPGGNAGKGRPKGVSNKLTADIKEMIVGALSDAGGQAYLARQAEENPGAFMTLVGKVLPMQLTGAEGKNLIPEVDQSKLALALLTVLHAGKVQKK